MDCEPWVWDLNDSKKRSAAPFSEFAADLLFPQPPGPDKEVSSIALLCPSGFWQSGVPSPESTFSSRTVCPFPYATRPESLSGACLVFPHQRGRCRLDGVPAPSKQMVSQWRSRTTRTVLRRRSRTARAFVERGLGLKPSPAPCPRRRRRRLRHKEHVIKSTYVSIDRSFLTLFSVFALQPAACQMENPLLNRIHLTG